MKKEVRNVVLVVLLLVFLCFGVEADEHNQFGFSMFMGTCLGSPINEVQRGAIGEYPSDPSTFGFGMGFSYHFVPWYFMYLGTNPRYTCNIVSQFEDVYDPHYEVDDWETYYSVRYSEGGLFNNVDVNHMFEVPVVLGFRIPVSDTRRHFIYIEGGMANAYLTATEKYHIGVTSQLGFDYSPESACLQFGVMATYYKDIDAIIIGGTMNFLF